MDAHIWISGMFKAHIVKKYQNQNANPGTSDLDFYILNFILQPSKIWLLPLG